MAEKSVHIVFRVLNFICADICIEYRLLPIDKLLLLVLAKFNGPKGICPSTTLLAKSLKITPTYVKERINRLDDLGIIKVTRKLGVNHTYELLFLNHNLSTTIDELENVSQSTVVDQSYRADPSTTASEPVNPGFITCQPQLTVYNKDQSNNNIDSALEKSPRASRKKPLIELPKNLSYTDEHKSLATELSVDVVAEFEKFKDWHEAKGNKFADWGAAFRNWIKKAAEFKRSAPQLSVVKPFGQVQAPSRHYPDVEEMREIKLKQEAEENARRERSRKEIETTQVPSMPSIGELIREAKSKEKFQRKTVDEKGALDLMRQRLMAEGKL